MARRARSKKPPTGASVDRERRLEATKLSEGEMELMGLLWQEGPLTLAEVHQRLLRPIGYTTVQTRLNRLVTKGLARRTTTRPAQYEAAVSAEAVSAGHLADLVQRVAGGRVMPLVSHLVSGRDLTADEIDELKALVAEAESRLSSSQEETP